MPLPADISYNLPIKIEEIFECNTEKFIAKNE